MLISSGRRRLDGLAGLPPARWTCYRIQWI